MYVHTVCTVLFLGHKLKSLWFRGHSSTEETKEKHPFASPKEQWWACPSWVTLCTSHTKELAFQGVTTERHGFGFIDVGSGKCKLYFPVPPEDIHSTRGQVVLPPPSPRHFPSGGISFAPWPALQRSGPKRDCREDLLNWHFPWLHWQCSFQQAELLPCKSPPKKTFWLRYSVGFHPLNVCS